MSVEMPSTTSSSDFMPIEVYFRIDQSDNITVVAGDVEFSKKYDMIVHEHDKKKYKYVSKIVTLTQIPLGTVLSKVIPVAIEGFKANHNKLTRCPANINWGKAKIVKARRYKDIIDDYRLLEVENNKRPRKNDPKRIVDYIGHPVQAGDIILFFTYVFLISIWETEDAKVNINHGKVSRVTKKGIYIESHDSLIVSKFIKLHDTPEASLFLLTSNKNHI